MKRTTIVGAFFLTMFLIGSLSLLGPLRGHVPIYFGKNPVVHILLLLGVSLYLFLALTNPRLAKKCLNESFRTLARMLMFILSAIFIAGWALVFLPRGAVAGYLGEQAGIIAVFIGIAIGSILPACPFVSYPIIAGIYGAGAGLPGIMGLLFGAGLAFPCYLSNDLAYFGSRILVFRSFLTLASATVAGILVYFAVS